MKNDSDWKDKLANFAKEEFNHTVDIPESSNENSTKTGMRTDHIEDIFPEKNIAKAPYNFIPLNDVVVEAQRIPEFNKYHEARNTGYIELIMETQTPLYIRDTLNENELDEAEKLRKQEEKSKSKDNKKFINPNFFSPNGKPQIPGSSIRGMVRTLVEILSYGKFGYFDDKRLYFRGVADRFMRDAYAKKMMSEKQGVIHFLPTAGYLKKENNKYTIIPAKKIENDDITFYKVEEEHLINKNFYPHPMSELRTNREGKKYKVPNKDYKFFTKSILFKKSSPDEHKHRKNSDHPIKLYYGKVTDIKIDNKEENIDTGLYKGTLICTGWMHGKHMHWVINEEDTNADPLEIDDKLLQSYKDDVNRDPQADLLDQLVKKSEGEKVPCFYITDSNGKFASFGHTGMFRLAYDNTIGNHIPDHLKTTQCEITEERLFWIQQDEIFCSIPKDKQDFLISKLNELKGKKKLNNEFEKELKDILKRIPNAAVLKNIILKHTTIFDIAESIFGNETLFAGRVFFEDAFLDEDKEDVLMGKSCPQILSSPKPTTFQHYLVQTSNHDRNHYDNNEVSIRGNKFYWHKSGIKWEEDKITFKESQFRELLNSLKKYNISEHSFGSLALKPDKGNKVIYIKKLSDDRLKHYIIESIGKNETQHTKIEPVKSDTTFIGKIRFENLTDVELGALLFALKLPPGCYHKIGMGKPLGLGSIYIKPKLYLSNRNKAENNKRYTQFSSEWNNELSDSAHKIDNLKETFNNHILTKIQKEKSITDLWDTRRLQELKKMLNFKDGQELEKNDKIRYMLIDNPNKPPKEKNEFAKRPILPKPSKV